MEQGAKPKKEKKRLGCIGKALIGLVGIIAVGFVGFNVWFNLNREKIMDTMLSNTSSEDHVGKQIPAFDVEQPDGNHITWESLSKGKDLTVIVLYASWCGPCEKEFPQMDAVYRKYQDKMGMVGIDIDFLDSMEDVQTYKDSHNLSFPLAYGHGNETLGFVTSSTYPTTLIVDRNGIIRFWRVGSIPTAEVFEKLVTPFMGEDYTQAEPAYYTFLAYANGGVAPGVKFTVTTKDGDQTYVTDESGSCAVFFDQREDMPIKVTSVPDGVTLVDNGETTSGLISTIVRLPVK